ncbi:MAG TPA: hypothetical protein VFY05_01655 [Candidatus Angelobacter sp.]|nr:hypothetical protein [Candidatus Angelobacter sp.]
MLPNQVQQFSAGLLLQVYCLSANQLVIGAGEFRQIEGERQLSLEPWLDRVAVLADYIHRVGAGERDHMLVYQFSQQRVLAGRPRPQSVAQRNHEQDADSRHPPLPPEAHAGMRVELAIHGRMQIRRRGVALRAHLYSFLQRKQLRH